MQVDKIIKGQTFLLLCQRKVWISWVGWGGRGIRKERKVKETK